MRFAQARSCRWSKEVRAQTRPIACSRNRRTHTTAGGVQPSRSPWLHRHRRPLDREPCWRWSSRVVLLGASFLVWACLVEAVSVPWNGSTPLTYEQISGQLGGSGAIPCPRCSQLFPGGQPGSSGEVVHDVHVQERGEPKSGTKFMFEWATSALLNLCEYLKVHFGRESCNFFWSDEPEQDRPGELTNRTLIFDPDQGTNASCPCIGVERVTISISKNNKHKLPVPDTCPWSHAAGIAGFEGVCNTVNGQDPVHDRAGLYRCIHESVGCQVTDKRHQMVVFRDPRAVVVSSFFFQSIHHPDSIAVPLDEYVMTMFPIVCKWTALRYELFGNVMAEQSTLFWHDEALVRPRHWYERWLRSIGVHLPDAVVRSFAVAAVHKRFHQVHMEAMNEGSTEMDPHPGGQEPYANRSFRSEISEEVANRLEPIMRHWLHPVLLKRFGVSYAVLL